MIATITLYGADVNVASSPIVASITDVEALSGVVSCTLEVDWVEPSPKNEGEATTYLNNFQTAINGFRIAYNIISVPQDFPNTDTDYATYLPFLNVIANKYNWVDLNDYKLNMYTGQDGTNCLRINILDYTLISEGGKKHWNITLGDVKQNLERS